MIKRTLGNTVKKNCSQTSFSTPFTVMQFVLDFHLRGTFGVSKSTAHSTCQTFVATGGLSGGLMPPPQRTKLTDTNEDSIHNQSQRLFFVVGNKLIWRWLWSRKSREGNKIKSSNNWQLYKLMFYTGVVITTWFATIKIQTTVSRVDGKDCAMLSVAGLAKSVFIHNYVFWTRFWIDFNRF